MTNEQNKSTALTEFLLKGMVLRLKLAIKYLEHPDVAAMPFVLSSTTSANNIKNTINLVEAYLGREVGVVKLDELSPDEKEQYLALEKKVRKEAE